MKKLRTMKRPQISTIIACIALFLAIGGTATAAKLINGKNIKKGTVTAKQIKNSTITSGKISPATIASLKGAQGPKGEKGAKGDTGAQGVQGPAGVAGLTSFMATNDVSNQPANDAVTVISMNNMPSSKYFITAKSVMFSNTAGALVGCSIETNNGGGGDGALWTSTANFSRNTVPMILTTATKVTQIKVVCDPGNAVGGFDATVVAVPTS